VVGEPFRGGETSSPEKEKLKFQKREFTERKFILIRAGERQGKKKKREK